MANIEKYLSNKGIIYQTQIGGSEYLPGVNPVIYPIYIIQVPRPASTEASKQAADTIRKLRRYCRRYGFSLVNRTLNGIVSFKIISYADIEKFNNYKRFQDRSINAVEKYIHIHKTFDLPVCDEYIAGIMEHYAREYKTFLKAVNN